VEVKDQGRSVSQLDVFLFFAQIHLQFDVNFKEGNDGGIVTLASRWTHLCIHYRIHLCCHRYRHQHYLAHHCLSMSSARPENHWYVHHMSSSSTPSPLPSPQRLVTNPQESSTSSLRLATLVCLPAIVPISPPANPSPPPLSTSIDDETS